MRVAKPKAVSLPPTNSNLAVSAYFEMTVFVMTYVRHSRAPGSRESSGIQLTLASLTELPPARE